MHTAPVISRSALADPGSLSMKRGVSGLIFIGHEVKRSSKSLDCSCDKDEPTIGHPIAPAFCYASLLYTSVYGNLRP